MISALICRVASRSSLVGARLCHADLQSMHLIKTFDKAVDPFSKINIETPMNIRIAPIDLDVHPDGDRLVLNVYSRVEGNSSEFTVKQTPKRVDLVAGRTLADADAVCVVRAPVRASFDILAKGNSSITIDRMHSDECVLRCDSGGVRLKDVRGQILKVSSGEGDVVCEGTILVEKIDIRTKAGGDVKLQHVRANELKVSTDGGSVSTDSCYSDASHFTTVAGSLKLSNVHRHCTVEILERGDLSMIGFDGTVKAILKRGNVHLQASKMYHENSVFIHESGSVDLSLGAVAKEMSHVELIAKKVVVDDEILKLGKVMDDRQHQKYRYEDEHHTEHNSVYVECRNGSVELKISSWKDMMKTKGIEFSNKT